MATPRNASVVKAFQILQAFAAPSRERSIADIAAAASLSTATAHRFLLTLEEVGAVTRTDSGRYALGPVMSDLGERAADTDALGQRVAPHLSEIVARFGETATLAALVGQRVLVLRSAEPERSLKIGMPVGRALAPHASSVGKILLAGQPDRTGDNILGSAPLPALTARTLTDKTALAEELTQVRRQGFALDDEEMEEGLRCLAVPLRDESGAVRAALSISGPTSRMTAERLDAMREALTGVADAVASRRRVESRTLPGRAAPRGPYPHIKRVGDFVMVSGTSARRADGTFEGAHTAPDGSVRLDIAAQTRAAIRNVGEMLATMGLTLEALVEIECFLVDMADYAAFNAAYGETIGNATPARTTVGIKALPHPHQLIMIRSVAFGSGRDRSD